MTTHSFYELTCNCGTLIRTETPDTICPSCKRRILIQWLEERKQVTPQPINEPKKRSAA